ncbi:Predicted PurR-regulated permease PerM [Albimonas donghaensis]|uniref:Predicted PurR-regulated permease PerM n=1 Tax=Albimonas donghaensis TaxID=356660 RepID=A0A1H2SPL4_9RHOB|nr:AI-2E family transporter [Albimonas donghaensis]SDW33593.1 Predicted PurR-regulated permease PerM [Albimonas donghaensis]
MALSVGEQVRWWTVGLAVLILFFWVMSGVMLPFLAGAALAYFLDPAADRLEARGLSRAAATAVITVIMGGLFVAVLLLLIPAFINQAQALIEQAPVYAEAVRNFVETRYPEMLEEGSPLAQGLDTLRGRADEWSMQAVKSAWTGGLAVIDFVTLLVITPVVAFYLLMDWDRLTARIDGWIPRDHVGTVRKLASDIDSVLAGFVRGQLTVCAILGTFYALALMLAGLQFGLVIGLFAGLISFIPFIGSIVGGLLSVGVALFQFWDDPLMILIVVGIFFAGQAVEGNFLTPKLVGGSVGLHPVALMFALSAFGSLLGFTGMLIAVPTAAAIGVVGRFAIDQYTSGRLYQGHEGQAEAQAAAARSEERAEVLAARTFPPAAAERAEEETPG